MAQVRDIVVVGAALGGVTAIAKMASAWPKELHTSLVIALATPEQPAPMVLQIIDTYAPVDVAYAIHGEAILPRRIYLSPLHKHMVIGKGGLLLLEEGSAFDAERPSVNRLFASAAAVYGPRVIGIVLSGNAKDGVQGMMDIERAGGVGIVQEPNEASEPLMPANVVRKDHPMYRARAAEIGPLLLKLMRGV